MSTRTRIAQRYRIRDKFRMTLWIVDEDIATGKTTLVEGPFRTWVEAIDHAQAQRREGESDGA